MKARTINKLLFEKGYILADILLLFEGYLNSNYNLSLSEDIDFEDERVEKMFYLLDKKYPPCYLSGYVLVRGLKVFVNENTLIPRTETIDFITGYLKENYDFNNKDVLDLCTGSGIISILIKKYFPQCNICGSDISLKALDTAKRSASFNNLDIDFICSDFLNDIDKKFSFIICNPPYIESGNKEVDADYEPELALFSGEDGLDSYRKIFSSLSSHLYDDGIAFFEIETSNYQKVKELAETSLKNYRGDVYFDVEKKERYLILSRY